jgi:hypothetical protein
MGRACYLKKLPFRGVFWAAGLSSRARDVGRRSWLNRSLALGVGRRGSSGRVLLVFADRLHDLAVFPHVLKEQDLVAVDLHGVNRAVQFLAELDQRQLLLGLLSCGVCLVLGTLQSGRSCYLEVIDIFQGSVLSVAAAELTEVNLAVGQEYSLVAGRFADADVAACDGTAAEQFIAEQETDYQQYYDYDDQNNPGHFGRTAAIAAVAHTGVATGDHAIGPSRLGWRRKAVYSNFICHIIYVFN